MGRRRCAPFLLAVAVLTAARAEAAPFTYTLIAESTHPGFLPPLSFFGGEHPGRTLALNDQGQVAFYAGWAGIYRGDGVTLTPLARVSEGFSAWVAYGFRGNVALNQIGEVAFLGGGLIGTGEPYGLWVSDGVNHTLRVDGGSAQSTALWDWVSLSTSQDLAYTARSAARAAGGVYLDLHTGGELLLAPEGGESPDAFVRTRLRASNETGQVAFFGERQEDSGRYGIYRADVAGVTPIALLSDGFTRFAALHSSGVDSARRETLTLTDTGQVAFWGERLDGSEGLFRGDGGALQVLVDTDAGFTTFGHWRDGSHTVLLNAAGAFAFLAERADGYRGIFLGGDGIQPVIGLGDPFFGSTVTELVLSQAGLNSSGELAFIATLADGREVIVRATLIPEPAALWPLLLLGALLRRRPDR